jgi:hypothetical protein
MDRYDHADRVAMLARYAELTGGPRPVLGDRPPERVLAALCDRGAARDLDGFIALFADDVVDVDHCGLPWEVSGKDAARTRRRSTPPLPICVSTRTRYWPATTGSSRC